MFYRNCCYFINLLYPKNSP